MEDSVMTDDLTTLTKVTDILENQLDFEIFLKQQELVAIDDEIAKAHLLTQKITYAVSNDVDLSMSSPSFGLGFGDSRRSSTNGREQRRNKRESFPSVPSLKKVLYIKLVDGSFVRITCPACKRSDFLNMQGFINHTQNKHKLNISGHLQAVSSCGVPVTDETEIPFDHPVRSSAPTNPSLPKLKFKTFSPTNESSEEKRTIVEYEEDVDFDNPAPEVNVTATKLVSSPTLIASDIMHKGSSNNFSGGINSNSRSIVINNSHTNIKKEVAEELRISKNHQILPTSSTGRIDYNDAEHTPSYLQNDSGSRFYIKRRVVLGNVCQYIPTSNSDGKAINKWMIYLRGMPDKPDISSFVTKVRFFLHPDFRPNDVIDVTEPPFTLTRSGWGEFPIRLEVYFVDEVNKPINLIHYLKLDLLQTGKQLLGSEKYVDIELDRNTVFRDDLEQPGTSYFAPNKRQKRAATQNPDVFHATSPTRPTLRNSLPKPGSELPKTLIFGSISRTVSLALSSEIPKFPLLQTDIQATQSSPTLHYTPASTIEQFNLYSLGKQKYLEYMRSRQLRFHIQSLIPKETEHLTTKEVQKWCREMQFNMISPLEKGGKHEESEGNICNFCGVEDPQHLSQDCEFRICEFNTVTKIHPLVKNLKKSHEEDEYMLIDALPSKRSSIKDFWHVILPTVSFSDIKFIWNSVAALGLSVPLENRRSARSHVINDDVVVSGTDDNTRVALQKGKRSSSEEDLEGILGGQLFFQVVKVFLKKLLESSVDVYRDELAAQRKGHKALSKLMVPKHVYQAINGNPDFEFLTNSGMGE